MCVEDENKIIIEFITQLNTSTYTDNDNTHKVNPIEKVNATPIPSPIYIVSYYRFPNVCLATVSGCFSFCCTNIGFIKLQRIRTPSSNHLLLYYFFSQF